MKYFTESKKDLKLFLYKEIENICKHAGGPEKLSLQIGKSKGYIRRTLDREKQKDNMNRLEKLYLEIKKHYGTN